MLQPIFRYRFITIEEVGSLLANSPKKEACLSIDSAALVLGGGSVGSLSLGGSAGH